MPSQEDVALAQELFQRAYQHQMQGELDLAEQLYKESIQIVPTAEAYTFLGWTYSFQGKLDEAIGECRKAILIDPDFGNPYNDIGAYLIQQGKLDEAIPWLEKALRSRRYEAYHYPHFNLGRVYVAKEMFKQAMHHFQEALRLQPDYTLAEEAIRQLKRRLN
ncbi:MAG TPA: tetratricopeptide repeat protein [Acidobacteriota bacterium]|nr:tetratricopeptide repeat protein [Acidobacteriota bacterium]